MDNLPYVITDHLKSCIQYIGSKSGFTVKENHNFVSVESKLNYRGFNLIAGHNNSATLTHLPGILKLQHGSHVWFSGSYDDGIADNLISHGFTKLGPLTGVARRLDNFDTSLTTEVTTKGKLTISPVINSYLFEEWTKTFNQVFGANQEDIKQFFKGFSKDNFKDKKFILLLAKLDDKPVGVSILYITDKIAGCYYGGVIPEVRKQGIGTSLTIERMKFAKTIGCDMIVAQCLNTSLNIFLSLEFKPYNELNFAALTK
jgi:hypothetical protein